MLRGSHTRRAEPFLLAVMVYWSAVLPKIQAASQQGPGAVLKLVREAPPEWNEHLGCAVSFALAAEGGTVQHGLEVARALARRGVHDFYILYHREPPMAQVRGRHYRAMVGLYVVGLLMGHNVDEWCIAAHPEKHSEHVRCEARKRYVADYTVPSATKALDPVLPEVLHQLCASYMTGK